MTGRPSIASSELLDAICEAIADGDSLREICKRDGAPNRSTVLRWLNDDDAFAAKYARAREAQGDVMDERILEVAEATTPENAAAARVKIDAFKWRASKLAPKRYGDRTVLAGDAENPIHTRNTTIIDVSGLSSAALKEIVALAAPDPS